MRYNIIENLNQVDSLLSLINLAYRSDEGDGRWTTEKHLVEGDRISREELVESIQSPDAVFIAGYLVDHPIACICLDIRKDHIEFGKYAICPDMQGKGYGKHLLAYAEDFAKKYDRDFQVSVVSQNKALVNYYEKRGYKVIKTAVPYPSNLNVGQPKVVDIDLTIMRKATIQKPTS